MQYGRYQIVAELGRGSMGVVYRAHDPQIDRTIALKVLREDRVTSEDFVQRFLKEAMAVGRLSHPAIVTVYDVGRDHGSIYIAMEFLQGQPLDVLMAAKTFSLEEVVDIGIQAAEALHYAHQRGIVHRDIKPPNIILSPEGLVRITDFGIARIEDPNGQQLTQVGEILGTPRYMSPEQAMGQPLDGRSDLYSLGVILYQLTTGGSPYKGDTLVSIFRAITQDIPTAPHLFDHQVPKPLSGLIMRLLDKKSSGRFATGEDLISELRGCLYTRPPASKMSAPVVTAPPRQPHTNWTMVLSCLLVLVICIGVGGYYYLAHRDNLSMFDEKVSVKRDNAKKTHPEAEQKEQMISPATEKTSKAGGEDQSVSVNTSQDEAPPPLVVAESRQKIEPSGAGDSPTVSLDVLPKSLSNGTVEEAKAPVEPENDSVQAAAAVQVASKQKKTAQNLKVVRVKERQTEAVSTHPPRQKQLSISPSCQALLKKFKLGDASVIERFQKECSGH